jgi:hypothetical protein
MRVPLPRRKLDLPEETTTIEQISVCVTMHVATTAERRISVLGKARHHGIVRRVRRCSGEYIPDAAAIERASLAQGEYPPLRRMMRTAEITPSPPHTISEYVAY